VFRLYPAWLVSAALAVLLGAAGMSYGLPAALGDRPWLSALAHLTMLQDLLGVPNAVNVYWTLSYEMVFYLLVTAMFVAGVHRSSARVALGFGVGAAMLGVALPSGLLASRWPGGTVLAAALLLAAGLAAMAGRRRGPRRAGVAVVAALALGLLVLNSRIGAIESLCVIATMFAGTAVRGVQDGRLRPRPAVAAVVVVAAFTLVAGLRTPTPWALHANPNPLGLDWSIAVAAAWLTFLAALVLRECPMPRALVWAGLVSYSMYLLHPLVVQAVWYAAGRHPGTLPGPVRLMWGVVLVTAVLGAAALGHRYVELPAQRLGRRLTTARVRAAGRRPRTATASTPPP
jgi:peptidoglycan/LPS O-acetylase OafA/YrhL